MQRLAGKAAAHAATVPEEHGLRRRTASPFNFCFGINSFSMFSVHMRGHHQTFGGYMHQLSPGSFHGSMPSPDLAGARLGRKQDLCFSAVIVVAALATWASTAAAGPVEILPMAKIICAQTILIGLMGMWLIERTTEVPRLSIVLLFEAVGRRLDRHAFRRAVILGPKERAAWGITGVIEDLVAWTGATDGDSGSAPALGEHYSTALRAGRNQARQIVTALYSDADVLSQASGEIEAAGHRLTTDIRAAGAACSGAQTAISTVTESVTSLTSAVVTTTAEAKRVTALSVSLSEQAFASQRCVAGLDDKTATLLVAVEQIDRLLQRMGTLGQAAAVEAARQGEAGRPFAPLAAGVQELAGATLAAVAGIEASLREMTGQAASAARTTQELCERVKGQHDLGLALSQAVAQQGEDVGQILRGLDEAQSGFVTLRASVEAVARHGTTRMAKTEQLRAAAARLPGHADMVSAILQRIPDFSPHGGGEF